MRIGAWLGSLLHVLAAVSALLHTAAAAGADLSLTLLPPIVGSAEPQLAINWGQSAPATLDLRVVGVDGRERPLRAPMQIQTGLHLEQVSLAGLDAKIVARALDKRGELVARAELSADPGPDGSAAIKGAVEGWKPTFGGLGGPDGNVRAIQIWNDGTGDAIYVAGDFLTSAGLIVNHIARWKDSDNSWATLGTGMNGPVSTLVIQDGQLVAGGEFTLAGGIGANRVARWNGTAWSSLGAGMNGPVKALTVISGELIAGGEFTSAGGAAANRIARWSGSNWLPLGDGMDDSVEAMAVQNGALIAGGKFTMAGGVTASHVARWNGSEWTPLGLGVNGPVRALSVYNSALVAGGDFTRAGSTTASFIARWNGSTWFALGAGLSDRVSALKVYNGSLITGGDFAAAGGTPISRIARWNGSTWSTLSSGTNGEVSALEINLGTGELIVGGSFTEVGGLREQSIARWNGSGWSGLSVVGKGMNFQVQSLTVYNGDLIAGGSFTTSGGVVTNRIARWSGNQWAPMGAGMNGPVRALAVYNAQLIAGGEFTIAGGTSVGRIARWTGSSWVGLGTGLNGTVLALSSYGGDLVAGGSFSSAGGVAASNVARWNGNNWAPMEFGTNGEVRAFTHYGGELIAAGDFISPGEYVIRWNGIGWARLDSGPMNSIRALTVYDNQLIVAGYFTSVGGFGNYNRIARWNGSVWTQLGMGLNSPVLALAVHNGELVAAGDFTTAGGTPAERIARWDGANWSAMGAGANNSVLALTVYDSDLIVGGVFSTTNGSASAHIAAYGHSATTTTEVAQTSPSPSRVGDFVVVRARVMASTGPTTGPVTVAGTLGGSCTDQTPVAIDSTTSEAECSIRWTTLGPRSLIASYAGGRDGTITWLPSASSIYVHKVTEPTTTTINTDLPDPSVVGEAIPASVTVTGTTVQPVTGSVMVTASSGESCTDSTATASAGTATTFACSITFNSPGTRTLSATFSGSDTHDDSTSLTEPHDVQPLPTLSINDVMMPEGASGATGFQFTITRSHALNDVSVRVDTSNGSASANSDYAAISGQMVNFAAGGSTTATVTIQISGDTIYESDETFQVVLSNPTGATMADALGVGTIINDDAGVAIGDSTVTEGATGITIATFTATLDGTVPGGFSLPISSSNGTATAASDYVAVPKGAAITFDGIHGEAKTVAISVTGDSVVEADETYSVTLGVPSNQTVTVVDGVGLGTIVNDDSASIAVNNATVTEGDSGTTNASLTVALSGDVQDGFTVPVASLDGSAVSGSDYVAIPPGTTLTFIGAAGETQTVSATITGDTVVEGNESFTVSLGAPSVPAVTVADGVGTGTVLDDDSATVAMGDVIEVEGDSGTSTFIFTATLSGDVQDGFAVPYQTAAGTAQAGSDYTSATGTLSFSGSNGQTRAVAVAVSGDQTPELDEVFYVDLGSPSRIGVSASPSRGTASIINDDPNEADISVTNSNGVSNQIPGASTTYTIVVANPNTSIDVPSVLITQTLPPVLTNISWTCVGAGGASCPTSGSGALAATVALPIGSSVTYEVTATLSSTSLPVIEAVVSASVAAPYVDPNAANNSATDIDTFGDALLADGFE